MKTNKEMYEAVSKGEVTFDEFENWVSDNRDESWNSAMDYVDVLETNRQLDETVETGGGFGQ